MTNTKRQDRVAFKLAGMLGPEGYLGRTLGVEALRVPSDVSLVRGAKQTALRWELPPWGYFAKATGQGTGPAVKPAKYARVAEPRLLEDFMALAEGPAERIESFARMWGPLKVCEHGVPYTHRRAAIPGVREGLPGGCLPIDYDVEDDGRESGQDPIASWVYFSRRARAVVRIAANLYIGNSGEPVDWQTLFEEPPLPRSHQHPSRGKQKRKSLRRDSPWVWRGPWNHEGAFRALLSSAESQWRPLVSVLEEWLAIGDVRPTLKLRGAAEAPGSATLSLGLGTEELFGVLGVQLVAAVAKSKGIALCSGCGNPYTPSQRLRADRGHYCGNCGRRAAVGAATTRYRVKKRTVLEMHARGDTIQEIAAAIGSDPKKVRAWIHKGAQGARR